MNKTYQEALDFAEEMLNKLTISPVQLIIAPPLPYIKPLEQLFSCSNVLLGAQNCAQHQGGAYTGEVSAKMLQSIDVRHVILGHSERRTYFNESNAVILDKVKLVIANGMQPIYCCGEQLEERNNEAHFEVVKKQLNDGLFGLSETDVLKCVIAYEPVWAIGTGVTATSDQAQEMHHYIRSLLAEKYSEKVAAEISILYGGSCKPDNAKELFSKPDIDGGLIGGASLNVSDFLAIANSF